MLEIVLSHYLMPVLSRTREDVSHETPLFTSKDNKLVIDVNYNLCLKARHPIFAYFQSMIDISNSDKLYVREF